jgi:hypothetical protein
MDKHRLPITADEEAEAILRRPGWCPHAEHCYPVIRMPEKAEDSYDSDDESGGGHQSGEICFGVRRNPEEYEGYVFTQVCQTVGKGGPAELQMSPTVMMDYIAGLSMANAKAVRLCQDMDEPI